MAGDLANIMSLGSAGMENRQLTGTGGIVISATEQAVNIDASAIVGASGANSTITSLTGLSTPLSTSQGGTGATSLASLATSGANSNITSLTGLTTPLSVAQGGTGTALFTSGTVTFASAASIAVVDATITSSSIVVVTTAGTTPLAEEFSVKVNASTGFTIYSTNSTSTAIVNWIRVK